MERVECSADLLEVKGARMSSKSSPWTTGRDALEPLTTAETATFRRGCGELVCVSDRTGLTSSLQREEFAKDVQELSASSAWGSGDCNGDAVTCSSTSAGAVRPRSHTIETRYTDRREAWVHWWKENRTDDVSSEAHGGRSRRCRGECRGHS